MCISAVVNACNRPTTPPSAVNGAEDLAAKSGVKLQAAQQGDFTPEAWNRIQSLEHGPNGTVSSMADGRAIHSGFRMDMVGKGKELFVSGRGRADLITNGIIYELKPNNLASIAKGISQLQNYKAGLKGITELIIIFY